MRAVRDEAELAARLAAGDPAAPGPARVGPGPSRLRYRLQRAWAKPGLRNLVGFYLPIALVGLVGWAAVSDDELRRLAEARVTAAWEAVQARPEFALKGIEIAGGSEALRARAHEVIGLGAGVSSLAIDVAAIRARIEALDAIRAAEVRLDPQGILRVQLDAREAVALYRDGDGALVLIDADGVRIGHASQRALYPRLPLILGEGGAGAVHDVLSLMDGAPNLVPRVRAFVRVGERRWDIVLEDDRVIRLPAEAPSRALARVMALHYGLRLLDLDVAVIDMRVPERPTLRLTPGGVEAYRLRQVVVAEGGKDT